MKWAASVVSLVFVASATLLLPYQAWSVLVRYTQLAAWNPEEPHRTWFDAAQAVVLGGGTVLSLPIAIWCFGSGLLLLVWVWDGDPPKTWAPAQTAATSASGACALPLTVAAVAQLVAALCVIPYHYRDAAVPGACLVGNQLWNALHAASVSAAFAPIGVMAAAVAWSCVRRRHLDDGSPPLATPWSMRARWHRVSRVSLALAGAFFAWVYMSRAAGSAITGFAAAAQRGTTPNPLSLARWTFVSPLVEFDLTIAAALLLVIVLGTIHTAIVTIGLLAAPERHDTRTTGDIGA